MANVTVSDPAQDDDILRPEWAVMATVRLGSAEETAALATALAPLISAGDTLLLSGTLGSGKTHFARALIRARLGPEGAQEEIPSPSFTLVQTYEAPDVEIWHADLYRLSMPDEVIELGLDAAFQTAICLIEWPDRLAPDWPDGVHITLDHRPGDGDETRTLTLRAPQEAALGQRLAEVIGAWP